MALQGKIEQRKDSGQERKFFLAEFSNGTIEQLTELANYLEGEGFTLPKEEADRLKEVVRIGISWLETVKNKSRKSEIE